MKILRHRTYRKLLDERNQARHREAELESRIQELEATSQQLQEQLAELEQARSEVRRLREENRKLTKHIESTLDQEINKAITQTGLSKEGFQKLVRDRQELIELYIEKLYSLAREMAIENRQIRHNRGLFLLLVDKKNMQDGNFSPFHEGQQEYLDNKEFEKIENIPQLFSTKIQDVLAYMAEKTEVVDEQGRVTGHRERDGALLIDLKGVVFRSCQMVEGVRTHKVYDRVERLRKGSARHNAAIYASSLDEVMAALVISEETSEVTLFRDGKFVQSYDPYTDAEEIRKEEQKVVPIQRSEEPAISPAKAKSIEANIDSEQTGSDS